MTGENVAKLINRLAVPTIISMLVTSLYNMADTYFVGTLGKSASGATGIVFTLMSILQAFGFMFGHGAGSHISRKLGARDVEGARYYSAMSFYASIVVGIIIAIISMIWMNPFMYILGSTSTILPYAKVYGMYILIAGPAFTASCVLNNILRYEGKAFFAMIGLTLGGVLNIFGDALFIKGFHWGIGGAGLSTAISQYISMFVLMYPYLKGHTQSSLHIKYLKMDMKRLASIIAVGFPSLMRQGLNAVSMMVLNSYAGMFGDAAIAGISIVNRVMAFLFCIAVGIGQGFQPVSAFNYGAKKYSRVKQGFIYATLFSEVLMLVAGIVGFVFSFQLVTLFQDDPGVIAIGTQAMHIRSVSLIFLPLSILGNMLFQSIGQAKMATYLAALRSGIILIPAIIILTHAFRLTGLEYAQAVSDSLASLISLPYCIHFIKQLPSDNK